MSPAIALSLLLSGTAQPAPEAQPPSIRWEKSFEDAMKKARKVGKPVIVDFWADWCAWCHRLDRSTYADPFVAERAQDFVAVKVDTEGSRREMDVAMKYEVTSLPTIVFLSPQGHQIARVNGFQGPGQFPRTLEVALAMARRVMAWEADLDRDPGDAQALAALGTHLYEQQYFDEARELLGKAVERDEDEPTEERRRIRMQLAILEHIEHNFAAAEKLVKEALALQPTSDEDEPKLLFVLGRTYVSWGRRAEGVATMQVIVRQYPQSPLAQKARETLTSLGQR
jgi:thiol-disulfide isomerase/thioredoxin